MWCTSCDPPMCMYNCICIHVGRILNRFSKDIGFLDDILPMTFYDYLTVSRDLLNLLESVTYCHHCRHCA